jgi:hypothetical protein
MQIAIAILVANANQGISYVKRLVKNFKARVLSYPNSIFEAEPCLVATLTELNAIGLLDNASLVITPNAYNEGILYDVIPNTTLGDMDVVRATTATRVNSAGLIEVVPRNLFQYSQNLANVAWATFAVAGTITRTANYAIAPDGSMTATRIQNSGGSTVQWTYQNHTISSNGAISMYVKRAGATNQTFRLFGNNGNSTSLNLTATSEWQRFQFVINQSLGLPCGITVDSSGNTADLLVWGAQLEASSTATEYFPTTTRLNIPRIDYTNGSCPSILVEPQRTNLALRSEEFSNATWEKGTPITLVSNTTETTSPFGINNATKATANGTGLIHIRQTAYSATTSPTTSSIFVKKANNRYVGLRNGGAGTLHDVFDFNTETWTNNSGSTLSFDKLINGWYRLKSSRTNTLANTYLSIIIPDNTSGNETATVSNLTLYIFGAQAELNVLYATSYIPTIASSVTRNADVISKTGISSLIGQTEGTLFCDVNLNSRANFTYFAIAPNIVSASTYIGIFVTSSIIGFEVIISGVVQSGINFSNSSTGRFKIAAAYKNNDFAFYINGNLIGIDTLGNIPACSELGLNAFSQAQTLNYNSAQLYKTRLTDEQLTLLTGDTYNSYAEMATNLNYILQ